MDAAWPDMNPALGLPVEKMTRTITLPQQEIFAGERAERQAQALADVARHLLAEGYLGGGHVVLLRVHEDPFDAAKTHGLYRLSAEIYEGHDGAL